MPRNIEEVKKKKKLQQGGHCDFITTMNSDISGNEAGAGEEQLEESMMGQPKKERKKEKKRHKTIQGDASQHDDGSNVAEGDHVIAPFPVADAEERNLNMNALEAEGRNIDERKKKKKRKRDEKSSEGTTINTNVNGNEVGPGEEQLEERIMGKTKSLKKGRKKEKKRHKIAKGFPSEDTAGDLFGEERNMVGRNHDNTTFIEADSAERNLKMIASGAEDRNTDAMKKNKKKKKKNDGDGNKARAMSTCTSANEAEEEQLDGNEGGDKLKRKSKSTRNLSTGNQQKGDQSTRAGVGIGDQSEESTPKRSSKRVSFAEEVEVMEDSLVRGKRFSPEEDEIVKKAVFDYVSSHNLGEEGLHMVLHCKDYPEVKNCWKEIGAAIPYRPYSSVYYRAHILFERDDKHRWTPEERELVCNFYAKHGADWKTLGKMLGKQRIHVKDFWRRVYLPNLKKGKWDQEEYQTLFDLVNLDLRVKALQETRYSKHGMLRDDIAWTAISKKLQTRSQDTCCVKWYGQLTSPMVAEGKWSDTDDYRLLKALYELDACCMEDVNWDDLVEHRTGDVCRQRWNQMVKHLGDHRTKPFPDQVDLLTRRYCPELLEVREAYDSLPVEP